MQFYFSKVYTLFVTLPFDRRMFIQQLFLAISRSIYFTTLLKSENRFQSCQEARLFFHRTLLEAGRGTNFLLRFFQTFVERNRKNASKFTQKFARNSCFRPMRLKSCINSLIHSFTLCHFISFRQKNVSFFYNKKTISWLMYFLSHVFSFISMHFFICCSASCLSMSLCITITL